MLMTASIVSDRLVSTDGQHGERERGGQPGPGPKPRRTRSYSSSTESVPAIAGGSRRLTEEKPSSFVLATCSHRSTGALSIETCPEGSSAP